MGHIRQSRFPSLNPLLKTSFRFNLSTFTTNLAARFAPLERNERCNLLLPENAFLPGLPQYSSGVRTVVAERSPSVMTHTLVLSRRG